MKAISGQLLKRMFASAANNLFNHYPEVDALNVFPVPDGDTGMNMNLTLSSGAKEINNKSEEDIGSIAKHFSRGLLMGARGNSGVIISQIFRGFAKCLEGKTYATAEDISDAFLYGKNSAYKAVMRPVEGTILTVIRESSESLHSKVDYDTSVEDCFKCLYEEAQQSLARTPELLPVLKEVGCVDSGGAGLVFVLEGMYFALIDRFVNKNTEGQTIVVEKESKIDYDYQLDLVFSVINDGTKKQYIEKNFKDFALHRGHNLEYQKEGDILKIKVCSLTPGTIIAYLQQFGEFSKISITPLNQKCSTDVKISGSAKDYALIAVSSGEGLDEIFKQVGVSIIVSGGQTMNPSIQDFVEAVKKANAKTCFILPNNSNIVMAANQASEVIEGDVDVMVVPSKTIPQGLTAAMMFSESEKPDINLLNMKSALKNVKSGTVTYSIKDTDIEGVHVIKNYYMGMRDRSIVSCVKDKDEALRNLVASMTNSKSSVVTIICGEDIDDAHIEQLNNEFSEAYPSIQFNIVSGKQPVYSYIVGVE